SIGGQRNSGFPRLATDRRDWAFAAPAGRVGPHTREQRGFHMANWHLNGSDQVVLETLQVFSRGLVERPAVYGVVEADAAEALRLVEAMGEALTISSNPATRTTLMTAAKNQARKAAVSQCQRLIRFIRANPNISDADRAAIGVPPPAENRRTPPPTTTPMLT